MNKKGFTLIELLAVLVVLAILALISIPITIRIINNARENSYKRSIESYGRAFELEIAKESMANSQNDYDYLFNYKNGVESVYSGNRVECLFKENDNSDDNYSTLINGKLILRGCRVVKNSNQLSNDTYIYENGKISREPSVDYHIGDPIIVAGEQYFILRNSLDTDDYVVALKKDILTDSELEEFGEGHINMYFKSTDEYYRRPNNGYIAYYTSLECGYPDGSTFVGGRPGCDKNKYETSEVKYIVDAWAAAKFQNNEIKIVDDYSARLLNVDDLMGLNYYQGDYGSYYPSNQNDIYDNYKWFWSGKASWTMIPSVMYNEAYHFGGSSTQIGDDYIYSYMYGVRPVINVLKSAIKKS